MDQYGKSDWVPLCFLTWTFECTIKNNVDVWISNKDTQTLCKFFFILHISSPNQEDCIALDAKCLVFLRFSQ